MRCPACQQKPTQVGAFWICPEHGQIHMSPTEQEQLSRSGQVFISYGRTDAMEFAKQLAHDLEVHGYRVWLDLGSIEDGALFEVRIEQGLRAASVVVAVMTPHSLREESVCRDEIVYALNAGKRILPLRAHAEAQPSLLLARRNWIDFIESYEQGLDRLLRFLSGDISAALPPKFATVTGVLPLDFGPEIARFTTGFTGRSWLHGEVDRWLHDSDTPMMVFVGEPGIGKSAIAAWLSQERSDVAGIHFCTQQNTRTRDPHEFVASLVGQLYARIPGYADAVTEKSPEVHRNTASDAFRELIIEPARTLRASPEPCIIIVDSIDEGLHQTGETILDVLVRQTPDLPTWLRVMATTRPVARILDRLRSLGNFELRADRRENMDDVSGYIVTRISREPLVERLNEQAHAFATILQNLAAGNFLYARLTLDALENGVLSINDLAHLSPELAGHYHDIFLRLFPDVEAYARDYAPLLRTLVAAQAPLSFQTLQRVIDGDAELLNRRLQTLRAYLRITGHDETATFTFYHQSFRDWLIRPETAGEYWVNLKDGRRILAHICWQEYQQGIDNMTEYALTYLPRHLCQVDLQRTVSLMNDHSYLANVEHVCGPVTLAQMLAATYIELTRKCPMSASQTCESFLQFFATRDESHQGIVTIDYIHTFYSCRPERVLLIAMYDLALSNKAKWNLPESFIYKCQRMLAELMRRNGQLDDAAMILHGLLQSLEKISGQLQEKAKLEYEIAYIYFLSGNFHGAATTMAKSAEHAAEGGDVVGSWISRCVEARCRFIAGDESANTFEQTLLAAEDAFSSMQDHQADPRIARWLCNVKAHKFEAAFADGNSERALRCLKELQDDRWAQHAFGEREYLPYTARQAMLELHWDQACLLFDEYFSYIPAEHDTRDEALSKDLLDFGRALLSSGQLEKAIGIFERGLACPEWLGNRHWQDIIQSYLPSEECRSEP